MCPCLICRGKKDDTYQSKHYSDHEMYHHAAHLECDFCSDLLKHFPFFSYKKSIYEGIILTYQFRHSYAVVSGKKPISVFKKKRSLECDECDRSFKKACNLERHYRNIHYQEKFECPDCHKLFGRKDNMRKHRMVSHGVMERKEVSSDETDDDSDGSTDDFTENEEMDENVSSIDLVGNDGEYLEGKGDIDDQENVEDEDENIVDEKDMFGDNVIGEKVCELNLDVISELSSEHSVASLKTLQQKVRITSNEDVNDEDNEDDGEKVAEKDEKKIVTEKVEKKVAEDVEKKVTENDEKNVADKDGFDRLKCQLCGKIFSTKFNLGVHEGKLKYSCESCDGRFCLKTALTVHMKNEHGKKKFRCDDCGKDFDVKCNMERHIKAKTKNNCLMCNSSFCNSHDLKVHVYSAHKVKECPHCHERYEYVYHHIETVHGSSSKN